MLTICIFLFLLLLLRNKRKKSNTHTIREKLNTPPCRNFAHNTFPSFKILHKLKIKFNLMMRQHIYVAFYKYVTLWFGQRKIMLRVLHFNIIYPHGILPLALQMNGTKKKKKSNKAMTFFLLVGMTSHNYLWLFMPTPTLWK